MGIPDARAAFVMPASGARRLRSTSTASAFSGETYRTRQRCFGGGGGSNISRFRPHRNAVSVLPLPVGARMSVDSPRAMAGHPSSCGRVGDGNDATNHSRTDGWKRSSTWPRAITRSKHVRGPHPSCPYNVQRSSHTQLTLKKGPAMADAGEGLLAAKSRLAERMEEREEEK